MTNEEKIAELINIRDKYNYTLAPREVFDDAIKALEAQTCIEDYPTCTECEHYDSEKHYCPRFCQVIKDTLAEAQPSEDTEVIKVSKGAVKARQGRFVIYDAEWLKEHFYETEEKIYGQPKKGHWISHIEHCESLGAKPSGLGVYEWCSNCDCGIDTVEFHRNHYNFCPNCGAEMSGGEEDGEDSACD